MWWASPNQEKAWIEEGRLPHQSEGFLPGCKSWDVFFLTLNSKYGLFLTNPPANKEELPPAWPPWAGYWLKVPCPSPHREVNDILKFPVPTRAIWSTARILGQNLKTQSPTVTVIFKFKMHFNGHHQSAHRDMCQICHKDNTSPRDASNFLQTWIIKNIRQQHMAWYWEKYKWHSKSS